VSEVRARPFSEHDALPDPFAQFAAWYADARANGTPMPEALAVATADAHGRPAARMVLLKEHGPDGFVFCTDRRSRKGDDLRANPRAALLFHWEPVGRQVRIEGPVAETSAAEAAAFAAARPPASRISSWASHQSQVITGRDVLERQVDEVAARFAGGDVPAPPHWTGYRVHPELFEFWQHREDRSHDRLRYRPDGAGGWIIERLSP
jgi:pyridoxamine 5'-phosphate oxidase